MATHDALSREDWVAARRALLVKEKELTRVRDELSQLRRELRLPGAPGVSVFTKGADGRVFHTYS